MSHAARGTVYIKPKFGPYKNYGRKIFDTKKLFLKKLSFKRRFLKYLDMKWTRYGHSKRVKLRISAWPLVINFLAFTEIVRILFTGVGGGGTEEYSRTLLATPLP